jgi:hypothetical protein
MHQIAQHELFAGVGGDLVVEIDEHGTVVGALDGRLDIAGFDPGQQAWCDEHVVDARAVVRFACADLRVPACAPLFQQLSARERGNKRTGIHPLAVWPEMS